MDKIKIVIIGGPTASGKSSLAVKAAKLIGGEIISCDSMQIYRGMDIGTAKISKEEMDGIPHYMLSVADPSQSFSAFDFAKRAESYIKTISFAGKVPIIVGGTGLYMEALIYPLTFLAKKDDKIRERLFEEYKSAGAEHMYERLRRLDPEDAAKIHPNNVKRVLRALEIYEISGKIKSECAERIANPAYEIGLFVINPSREELYRNIDNRVDEMFRHGIAGEVSKLLDSGLSWDAQSMQAIGYKEFRAYFDGSATLDEVKFEIKRNTRHYAKRQITWLKRYDFASWYAASETEKMLNDIKIFGESDKNE